MSVGSELGDDHGDDTQRRFRYQNTYAAILALELVADRPIYSLVYCEHHEDIVIEYDAGDCAGWQVKTRADETIPFKATEPAIVAAIRKFVRLDIRFPGRFTRFVIATNSGFWAERENEKNLPYLAQITKTHHDGLDSIAAWKKFAAKFAGISTAELSTCLSKLACQVGPTLRGVNDRLYKLLIHSRRCEGMTTNQLRRLVTALISLASDAASLANIGSQEDYFALLADPDAAAQAAVIEGKSITKEKIDTAIIAFMATPVLLEPHEPLKTAEPSSTKRLEQKMELGVIPAYNIELAKDHKASMERVALAWLSKFGPELTEKYYNHLAVLVLGEALEAHDEVSNVLPYGQNMLGNVRQRLRALPPESFLHDKGIDYPHLLGMVAILTEECKVWWSPPQDLGI